MQKMAPILGYWKVRGLVHATRIMLHYKEVEFEDKIYEVGDAPEYSRESWLKEKETLGLELPNLPYYIDGDINITENSAIFAYLGRKHGLCGSTEAARIRNDVTYSFIKPHRDAMISLAFNPQFETLRGPFVEGLPARLEKISKWLGDHQYFGGSEIVYADFWAYEILDVFSNFVPGCMDKYDNLKAYVARIEALPTVKAYLGTEASMRKGPFYTGEANWGTESLA